MFLDEDSDISSTEIKRHRTSITQHTRINMHISKKYRPERSKVKSSLCSIKHQCQALYCPTFANNVKNVELLKHFKIKEATPTCFGLQGNHYQGATDST
jgi:hypothetical protein